MKIDFASSRQSTLGVEWELALVDAETGELASVANEVLRGVAAAHPELNEDDEHPHIKQELLLPIVGGVFVMEAGSVIIQVISFKTTGKRVFRMAPIHHHFELGGWAEPKIITRFLILAIIFALFSLTTLKLR